MDTLAVSSVTREVSLTIDLKKLLALAQESPSLKDSKTSFLDQLVSVASTTKTLRQANIVKVKHGVGDAQALSTTNALENTQLNFKVSPTGDVAVTAVRLDRSTPFPKLPKEVRIMIWGETCSEPRIVEIEASSYDNPDICSNDLNYKSRTLPPAVLHVSSKARQEGLKHYTRAFRRALYCGLEHLAEQIIYINFETDTPIAFPGKLTAKSSDPLKDCLIQQRVCYPNIVALIKRIARPIPLEDDIMSFASMLIQCTGLKETILVLGRENNSLVPEDNQHPKDRSRLRLLDVAVGERADCHGIVEEIRYHAERYKGILVFHTGPLLTSSITCKRLERL
jgi:hypothetical protein